MNKLFCGFVKYSGCGNDFIIIDHRKLRILNPAKCAKKLCRRKVDIGADGLILLENSSIAEYKMRIFNADGSEAEMCGNGLRCLAHYIDTEIKHMPTFAIETQAGVKKASVRNNIVEVDVGSFLNPNFTTLSIDSKSYELSVIDTGVPHAIYFTDNITYFPLQKVGSKIRYHRSFMPKGVNFNLISCKDDCVNIRTYERGVENETLACGTGCIAAALTLNFKMGIPSPILIKVASGDKLAISFKKVPTGYDNVTMTANVSYVFDGKVEILP